MTLPLKDLAQYQQTLIAILENTKTLTVPESYVQDFEKRRSEAFMFEGKIPPSIQALCLEIARLDAALKKAQADKIQTEKDRVAFVYLLGRKKLADMLQVVLLQELFNTAHLTGTVDIVIGAEWTARVFVS